MPTTLDPILFKKDTYKLWVDDQVRFSDLDTLGHVNNLAVGEYIQNSRIALFAQMTPTWPHGEQLFVVAHTAYDFVHELHFPAHIRIGVRLLGFGKSSMRIGSAVFRENDVVAASEVVMVYIDQKTRRPFPIPDELRALITKTAG